MSVFLFILKIIGYILLGILGLLIFLLLLVLFVPIRYKGTFDRNTPNSNIRINGYVSFLLHILSIRVTYEEEIYYYVKIFGIKLKRKSRNKSTAEEKRSNIEEDNSDIEEETSVDCDTYNIDWNGEDNNIYNESSEINCEDQDIKQDSQQDSQDLFDRIDFIIEKITDKIDSISDKYDKFKKKYRYWSKMLSDEKNKSAAADIYKYVRKLIKKYIPYKCKGKLYVGFDDPATMGSVLMYLSIFYPILPKDLEIVPDFENVMFYGNAYFKGRIRLCHVAALLVKLFANRKIRRLWKLYKKHP